MSDLEKILSLAREQIGTAEEPPGSNNVIYNTDYYGGAVQGPGYPWCCAFVWWLFWKPGLSALFCGGQKTAYCPFVVNWARQHGQWVTGDYKPGDLLLYDWDGDGAADHIGICESDADKAGYLWAIEGNFGDAVQRVQRWTGSILGAYRPAYREETAPESPGETPEEIPESYTVQSGDTMSAIAERCGVNVYQLAAWNGIPDPNRIWPGQILRLRPPAPAGEPEKPDVSNLDTDFITQMAMDVIAGKYGNGIARVFALGGDYDRVQARVNEILAEK